MKNKSELNAMLKVLYLEHSIKDVELLNEMLVDAGYQLSLDVANGETEYVDFLQRKNYDIILSDNSIPGFNALSALKVALDLKTEIPFICVSGTIGEENAVELLKQGATDYVLKDSMGRLSFVVGRALKDVEQKKIRKQVNEALKESEERFQLLFNKAPLGYQSLDIDGNLIEVNQQWLDTLGYTREEVVGKWFGYFLSPDYQDDFLKRFPIFKAEGKIHSEFEMVHKNGNIIFIAFEGKIGYDTNGEFKQTHCILQDITDRKKAEEEVIRAKENAEENERRFEDITISTADWVWEVDETGIYTYSSKVGSVFFGISQDEIIGKSPFDFMPPDEAKRVAPIFSELMANKLPIKNLENWNINKNGERILLLTNGLPILDNKGNLKGYRGVDRDITEQKKITENITKAKELAEINEQKFRTLFENSPIGKSITGIDGSLRVNNSFCDIVGYSKQELLNKKWNEISYPDDIPLANEKIQSLLNGKKKKVFFEKRYIHKNGNIVWADVSVYLQRNNEKIPEYYITTIIDTTIRKQAEEELKLSSIQWKRTFDAIQDGVTLLDTNQNIIQSNQAFLDIIHKPETEVLNRPCFGFVHGTSCPIEDCPFVRMKKSKKRETMELEIYESVFEVIVDPIFDDAMNITGAVHIVKDITKNKQAESEIIEAKEKAEESDRLKSAFLTNMSHEIRTPMNGILGFTELLKEPNLSSDDQQDYIQTIQISGARMLNTINSIVDISKIESGLVAVDNKETDINEKMEFTYKFFKPEVELKELQFRLKNGLPSREAIIKTDNEKVYGILTNLVRNALKFTYKGSIEFGYEKKGQYLEFFVKDTGIGIPQNQHQIIFERFRQGSESHDRDYEGSGLGLSIAKSYVEMLGGKMWVESEEGRGSTFYFTIPYNAVSEEKIEIINTGSVEHKEVQPKNLKILIVEDDEISYSLLTRTLQKISEEVLHAITGVEAVEACRNNPDIELVLMDIRMPLMDGLEATHQIRQFNKNVIIIAQTAYAFAGDIEKAIEAGCNDYISKPINTTLLYELIKKHCSR